MADQAIFAPVRVFDANGQPAGGAKAYFYTTGTASLISIYDAAGIELANPLIADAGGVFAQAFFDGDARVNVTTADDVSLPGYPLDPVSKSIQLGTNASLINFTPTDAVPESNVQAAVEYVGDALVTLDASLGTFSTEDVATRTQLQATWNTGSNTTESLISAAKLRATIDARSASLKFRSAFPGHTITPGALVTDAHGFATRPLLVGLELRCVTPEAGYVAEDIIAVEQTMTSTSANRVNQIKTTATELQLRFSDQAACFVAGHATTGVATGLTNANWKLYFVAMA